MTDFKIAHTIVEELKEICEDLLNSPEDEVFNKLSLFEEFEKKLKDLQPVITRIRLRRNETDPTKKVYGEKMMKNVDDVLEKYETLYNIYEEELTVFKENHEIMKREQIEKSKLEKQKQEEQKKELIKDGRKKTQQELENFQENYQEKKYTEEQKEAEKIKVVKRIENIQEVIKKKNEVLYEEIKQACTIKQISKLFDKTTTLHSKNNYELNKTEEKEGEEYLNNTHICYLLLDSLYFLYQNNEYKKFKEGLRNIIEYLEQVVKNIESEQLKLVNLMNPLFEQNILSKKGSLYIFILFGYIIKTAEEVSPILDKLKRPIDHENIYIYLEEPNIISNYEKWKFWFDGIQNLLKVLLSFSRYINKYTNEPTIDQVNTIFVSLRENLDGSINREKEYYD